MVSNFFHVIQVFKKSVTLISKTEHIGFVIYSWRKKVSLQKYDCSLSGTSFVGFCLFSVYILAGDVVYADIKTVRTSPLELPSPLQRSVSFNFATVLKSCPVHKGKCHWIVETKKSWNESQNDYATKNSYLMVIQHITAMMITFLLYLQMASFQCLYLSDVSL
uniref:Uncharacterized protein n=1 Tax=Rhinopithecus bieti TaxID=61621 RepID=A0A2K6LIY8_RHIBE